MRQANSRLKFVFAAAGALLLMAKEATAQSTWTGLGSNENYTTGANWSGGVAPVNNGTATLDLPQTAAQQQILVNVNESINGILQTGTTGVSEFQFSGNSTTLSIGSGGISSQAGINSYLALNLPTFLTANETWDGTQGYVVAYQSLGESGGSRSLTVVGTVYLFGAVTFSGGLDVTSGASAFVQTSAGTGTVNLSNGAKLESYYSTSTLPNAFSIGNNVTLGSQGYTTNQATLTLTGTLTLQNATTTLDIDSSSSLTLSGTLQGPAGTQLTVSGSGSSLPAEGGSQLILTGTTAQVAGLTVNGAEVILAPTANPNSSFSSIAPGGINVDSFSYLGLGTSFVNPGAVSSFLSTYGATLGANISGSLGLDSIPNTSTNTFGDPIDLSGFSSANFLGLGTATSAILASSAVITPYNNQYVFGGGGGTLTVLGPLADGGSPRSLMMGDAIGPLTLLLKGGSSYTGGTNSQGGVLIFDSDVPLTGLIQEDTGYVGYTEMASNIANAQQFVGLFGSASANGIIGFDSTNAGSPRTITDSIDLSGFSDSDPYIGTATAVTLTGAITPGNGHYQFAGVKGGSLTVASNLTNVSASANLGLQFPIESAGSMSTVTMSGTNTYGGGTTIYSGNVAVTNPSSLGTGALNVPNTGNGLVAPSIEAVGADVALAMPVSVGTFEDGDQIALTLGNPNTSDLLTLSGVISDDGEGAELGIVGHVALTGANTFVGGINFSGNNPVLYVNNANSVGSGTINIEDSGSIIPLGANVVLSNSINLNDTLTLGTYGNANSLTLNGAITGGSGLDIESAVTLNGANTFSGGVTIYNAMVTIGNAEALGTGSLSVSNSTIGLNYANPTIEGLAGDADSQVSLLASSTLTLDVATDVSQYDGAILGDASNAVVKTGAGAEILGGSSTYAGGTTISAGTLVAGSNQSFGTGSITVASGADLGVTNGATLTNLVAISPGAILSGEGTFAPTGGFTISGGTTVQPGEPLVANPVATLSFDTSFTFGPAGVYNFNVINAAGTPGNGYGTIDVTGALGITATPGSPFVISVGSLNPDGTAGPANFTATLSYSWTILSAASITGFSASDFSINTSAFQNSLAGGSFSLAEVGGNMLTLDFTPVPEPSTWALLLSGCALAVVGIRRRSRA